MKGEGAATGEPRGDGIELWQTLARAGPKATAEALTPREFERLHIEGPIEACIVRNVAEGRSIVLTGNAGDGKTHLLERLRDELEASDARLLTDATAMMHGGDTAPVIEAWRAAKREGRPVCLAANEYPLFQLRHAEPDLFAEVTRQCEQRLAYGPVTADEGAGEILVVDLSLRNPLSSDFLGALLDRLTHDPSVAALARSGDNPVVARNLALLVLPRVRERLELLTARLVALGERATIRELWILCARMLFGNSGRHDYRREDWYSENLFRLDRRFDLTAALAAVDPAASSHPQWDAALEARAPAVASGWADRIPRPSPHPTLDSEAFAAMKRRFFFEHDCGEEVFALADRDAADFEEIVQGRRTAGRALVGSLIEAVNAAYCPVSFQARDQHLYLWSGHRFHEQPSRSFVATERVSAESFSVEIPRLPERLKDCFAYRPDHVALVATQVAGRPKLRIDFALFRTLKRLQRGLPRKLIPERDVHRLDAFLELLHGSVEGRRDTVWSVHLENLDLIEIGLSADGARYESVREYG